MNNSVTLYTWENPKGSLQLSKDSHGCSLKFVSKEQGKTSDIAKQNIKGIDISLEELAEDWKNLCSSYSFSAQKLKNSDEILVHLFEFENRDSFFPSKQQGQILKSLGSVGFTFKKLEKQINIPFSPDAPKYRTVSRGLNLEGECTNNACAAFAKNVIIPKGLGEFNIPQEIDQSQCPSCENTLQFNKIINLGFWNCKVAVKGKRIAPEEKGVDESIVAEKNTYTTYSREDSNCTWTWLTVITEKQEAKKQETKKPEETPSSNKTEKGSSGNCIFL